MLVTANYILILVIFKLISDTDADTVQLCLTYFKAICVTCQKYDTFCKPITTDMKIIHFDYNVIIDYKSYMNTNINMIEEPGIVTYYPCSDPIGYFQVNSFTYYPIGRNPSFLKEEIKGAGFRTPKNQFQKCLETYCLKINNNILSCHSGFIDSLDFEFNAKVKPRCVQNITYVQITSDYLSSIRRNYFFHQALNVISLKLNYISLRSIKCNSMKYLRNLKEIRFRVVNFTEEISPLCIFRHNPYLLLIEINHNVYWNPCKAKAIVKATEKKRVKPSKKLTSRNNKSNEDFEFSNLRVYVFIVILLFTFVVSALVNGYLYFRSKRTQTAPGL